MSANKRIVIKVGSQLLSTNEGLPDINNLRNLSFQISALSDAGYQPVLVSSGAILCGAQHIGIQTQSIPEEQAAAAVGQPLLIQHYFHAFQEKNKKIAQKVVSHNGEYWHYFLKSRGVVFWIIFTP